MVFDDDEPAVDVLPRRREPESEDLRENEDFRSLVKTLGTDVPRCAPLRGGGAVGPSRVVGREGEVELFEKKLTEDRFGEKDGTAIGPCIATSLHEEEQAQRPVLGD